MHAISYATPNKSFNNIVYFLNVCNQLKDTFQFVSCFNFKTNVEPTKFISMYFKTILHNKNTAFGSYSENFNNNNIQTELPSDWITIKEGKVLRTIQTALYYRLDA